MHTQESAHILRVLLSLALLAVSLGPRAVEGRLASCNGAFQCSSMTSSDPDLILEGTNASVACKYGHTEIGGNCRRGCDGIRSAPCTCQTQKEAEAGIQQDARTSLIASVLMILLGCCCICGSSRKLFKMKVPDETGPQDRSGAAATEQQDLETTAEMPPFQMPAAAAEGDSGTAGATAEASGPQRRSLVDMASGSAGRIAQDHPYKFRLARFIVNIGILALMIWGAYQLAVFEGHLYDTYGSFIGAVAVFMFALSLVSIIVLHLANRRCCSKDDPLACVSEAAGMVIMLVPFIGIVGLVWSVHRLLYPGGFYHAC